MRSGWIGVALLVGVACDGAGEPPPPPPSRGAPTVDNSAPASAANAQSRAVEGVAPKYPDAPTELPMVGPDTKDEFGYPHQRPDRVGLRVLLMEERFDELTKYMHEYQAAAEKDFRKERWPSVAMNTFDDPDPALAPLIDKWIAHSPDSWAPGLAKAHHLSAVAWSVRGGDFAHKVGDDRVQRMAKLLEESSTEASRVLNDHPKVVTAYQRLMLNSRALGVPRAQSKKLLDAALEACPKCYMPHRLWMSGLTPRWGGDYEQMAAYYESIQPQVKANPKLKVLAGMAAYDRCSLAVNAKDYATARRECDEAIAVVADEVFLAKRGKIDSREEKWEEALKHLDAVLAVWPQDEGALLDRSWVRFSINEWEDGCNDLLVARQLDPSNYSTMKRTQDAIGWVQNQAPHSARQGKHEEAERILALGEALWPNNDYLKATKVKMRATQGSAALGDEAEADPDDFDTRRARHHALNAEGKHLEAISMWDDFLKTHPEHGHAYLLRAEANHLLGTDASAILDLKKSCELGIAKACKLHDKELHK